MTSSYSRVFLIIIVSCLLALITMLLMHQTSVSAQEPCPYLSKLSLPQWRPGATITVYFDESYYWSDATITSIRRGFENWNAANGLYANNTARKANNLRAVLLFITCGFQTKLSV